VAIWPPSVTYIVGLPLRHFRRRVLRRLDDAEPTL
jgi:hypothetical protein